MPLTQPPRDCPLCPRLVAFREQAQRLHPDWYNNPVPYWGDEAASLIVIMLGAIGMVHGKNGFFLSNGGFEYNLALIGLLAPILIVGPGTFAVGRFLPLPKSTRTARPIVALE